MIFALSPDRVSKLGLETGRTVMLGKAAAHPGLYQHIAASHEAASKLVSFLTELGRVPVGITSEAQKFSMAWQAAQQAGTVLRAARARIEKEAKELAEEAAALAKSFWDSKLPDTATRLRAMEMLERYVGKGELANVSALMADPQIASVMATTSKYLIHPQLSDDYKNSVTRGALKQFQPDTIAKADKAEELLELASGYSEAIKVVDFGVSSATAAAAWDSRVQPPVMPDPVAA